MEGLKSVAGRAQAVEGWLKWEYWPYYALVLFLMVAVGLFLLWWLRRRGGGKVPLSKSALKAMRPTEKRLPSHTLLKVWRRFLQNLPRHVRRSLPAFQPFVIVGESGCGKSSLIDLYSDWKGQANQYHPSQVADPYLQIYLGSRALILELPASLLNDSDTHTEKALIRLWKAVFRRRDPIVVLVLNGAALSTGLPEDLRRQAQMIRGKINSLARVRSKPIQVYLVLTHMDGVEGYQAFSRFLVREGIPLTIGFETLDAPQGMENVLEPYEGLLSRALTHSSPEELLETVSFFRNTPELLGVLDAFVHVLCHAEPLSPTPSVTRLYLTSNEDSVERVDLSNPFAATVHVEEVTAPPEHRRHRLAAAILLACGLAYLGGGYLYEQRLLTDVDRRLDLMEASPPGSYSTQMRGLFQDTAVSLEGDLAFLLFPNFFRDMSIRVHMRLLEDVRQRHLYPLLRRMGSETEAQEKLVYLLGLLFATQNNSLGDLVRGHTEDWVDVLGVESALVVDYVRYNEDLNRIHLDWDFLQLKLAHTGVPFEEPLPWLMFFQRVQTSFRDTFITKATLDGIHKEAKVLLDRVRRVRRYELSGQIVGLLQRMTPLGDKVMWLQDRDVQLSQEPLHQFLSFVMEQNITYPAVEGMTLVEFMNGAQVMVNLAKTEAQRPQGSQEFRFQFGGESFSFNAADWNQLLERSRLTLFMREFEARNSRAQGFLFFRRDNVFPDVIMNASNDGLLLFTGKGKVDGRFTRMAFEQDVKPALEQIPDFLKTLAIADEEKTRFSSFILKQAETYADRYVSAYRGFYSQFHVRVDSEGGLRYVLSQIQLPSAPFQDFLVTMKDNTVLDVGEGPFLRQFGKKLSAFDFIRRLMAEKDGVCVELEKYKAILQQMQDELEKGDSPVSRKKDDDSAELKGLLSPLGRISLSIFRGEDDSYLSLVQMWIKSAGIGSEYQAPFLEPVQQAFGLGRGDVESTVAKVWNELVASYLKPLSSKFPFDPEADAEMTPAELEKLAHPQGTFWKSFRSYLAPVCREEDKLWLEKVTPQGVVRLPSTMLYAANQMARMAATLWNEKGAPQPVVMEVKPAPLPPKEAHGPITVLSYLRSGTASVFAFNQQPSWQKLDLEWWKASTAAVGVARESFPEGQKNYLEIAIPESDWSLFRLLRKGRLVDRNEMVWLVGGDSGGVGGTLRVEFSMKSDPWQKFELSF
jgi:hypothetical protein